MGGDITNEVLAERLDQLRRDQRDDLEDIKRQIGGLMPREVYKANRDADAAQIAALKTRVEVLESRGRWLVASVIVPVITLIVMVWLSSKGVKP